MSRNIKKLIITSSLFTIMIFVIFAKNNVSTPLDKQVNEKTGAPAGLVEGNKRFVDNKMTKFDFTKLRDELSKGQHPHTIVVTCSDSRVAPEYIFDEGLGEIFVIRTAGNVIDSVALGSIEYAAEHLHAKNILILGHTSCGAVTAALGGKTESPYINSIINMIDPCVSHVKKRKVKKDDILIETIKENVKNQADRTLNSEIIKHLFEKKEMKIYGGVYNIQTGKVDFILEMDSSDE